MGLIVDNFAGGGGASTGIEQALGRAIDIAINHDEEAIRMHEVNHPGTRHIRNNIWQIDPKEVTGGQPVDLAWFSPDCKHFSKAKGGKPRERNIRDLAWVVILWAQRVRPAVIMLENVEEFRTWGPLGDDNMPIKERAGETFDQWCKELRKHGYKLQFRELRACDYGAPTIRKRFFMVARCDGQPIVWPKPTHGDPNSKEVLAGSRKPWRTAAEIIDWSIPCPSIFERKKPLAEKTLRRIAHGIVKFVLDNPRPFIVPLTHHGGEARCYDGDQPLVTVTGANRGELAMVAPYFARTAHGDVDKNGKRRGQPCHGPEEPYPTVMQSGDSALVAAHITKFRTGAIGHAADEPLHTVTANSYKKRPGGAAPLGIVAAHLVHNGNGERKGQAPRAMDAEKPLGTVVAGSVKHHAVCALMQKFTQNGKGVAPSEPLHTVMAGAPRHALVTVHIEQANGGPRNGNLAGRAADAPLSTLATTGSQQRLVASNLLKLRGTCAHGQATDEPLHTISAGGNHLAEVRTLLQLYCEDMEGEGPVTVMIDGEEYAIIDIGMRMLQPRELFNAQGFPADYIIETDAQGRPMTKTAQVAKCGNSVCPPLARALVTANMTEAEQARESRAA